MKHHEVTEPYRIGRGHWRAHWAHRWHVDRWFRSWQSEPPTEYGLRFARRGWTPGMARWLMEKDMRAVEHGRMPLGQRWRTWLAEPRDRVGRRNG